MKKYTADDLVLSAHDDGYSLQDWFTDDIPQAFDRGWYDAHYTGPDEDGVHALLCVDGLLALLRPEDDDCALPEGFRWASDEDLVRAELIAEVGEAAKDWPWDAEAETITAPGWYADEGSECESHYPDAESREAAAREYVEDGDWGDGSATVVITIDTYRRAWRLDADSGEIEPEATECDSEVFTLEPEEPKCSHAGHDWVAPISVVGGIAENPGVWGHGAGTRSREFCRHCGVYREIDTWAQHDGEAYTSTAYSEADFQSREWIAEQSGEDAE